MLGDIYSYILSQKTLEESEECVIGMQISYSQHREV